VILGASFDTPADNLAFKQANDFPYALLSDSDKVAGTAYQVVRDPSHQYANFPERHSILIDPAGNIRRVYDVKDLATHAAEVLTDIDALKK
jgi:thioredoxin-dependent peroxiredoxin